MKNVHTYNVTVCLFVVQASYLRNTYIQTYIMHTTKIQGDEIKEIRKQDALRFYGTRDSYPHSVVKVISALSVQGNNFYGRHSHY